VKRRFWVGIVLATLLVTALGALFVMLLPTPVDHLEAKALPDGGFLRIEP